MSAGASNGTTIFQGSSTYCHSPQHPPRLRRVIGDTIQRKSARSPPQKQRSVDRRECGSCFPRVLFLARTDRWPECRRQSSPRAISPDSRAGNAAPVLVPTKESGSRLAREIVWLRKSCSAAATDTTLALFGREILRAWRSQETTAFHQRVGHSEAGADSRFLRQELVDVWPEETDPPSTPTFTRANHWTCP